MKSLLKAAVLSAAAITASVSSVAASAAEYVVDVKGAHAFVNFKIQHLGYSWLTGRFNTFDGEFSYDADSPEKSKINIRIDTTSIDSNHAERDKHLKGKDFLNVKKHPEAAFSSTRFVPDASEKSKGTLEGTLTLNGVTRNISFPVKLIGEGRDPWGNYRAGFEGSTSLKLTDYGISYNLGPASQSVQLDLLVEGIRK